MQIKKILVPYDYSKYSDKSLKYAIDLANVACLGNLNKQDILIILFHIIQQLPVTKSDLVKSSDKISKKLSSNQLTVNTLDNVKAEMERSIKDKLKKLNFIDKVKVEQVVLYGDPAKEFINYASKKKVDLIIIGSSGVGRAKAKGMGSVSRIVSENISCPITIIR